MLQRITVSAIALLFTLNLSAQDFTKLPSGIEYYFKTKNENGKLATLGSQVKIHISTQVKDSIVFDSKKLNKNQPVPASIMAPQYNGDLQEGFALMHEGDLATFRCPVDSVFRNKAQMPKFAKSGDWTTYQVEMVSVKTPKELAAEKLVAAEKAKIRAKSEVDSIKKYLATNKITNAIKTKSGLYYVITKKGEGPNAMAGQKVIMNYTGYLTNGEKFDSNVDPTFGHVKPFEFVLGQGQVIKGWDEGIALLNKGGKAKLIIPSGLAYGDRSPSPKIPANSILVFDVEMVGTK